MTITNWKQNVAAKMINEWFAFWIVVSLQIPFESENFHQNLFNLAEEACSQPGSVASSTRTWSSGNPNTAT